MFEPKAEEFLSERGQTYQILEVTQFERGNGDKRVAFFLAVAEMQAEHRSRVGLLYPADVDTLCMLMNGNLFTSWVPRTGIGLYLMSGKVLPEEWQVPRQSFSPAKWREMLKMKADQMLVMDVDTLTRAADKVCKQIATLEIDPWGELEQMLQYYNPSGRSAHIIVPAQYQEAIQVLIRDRNDCWRATWLPAERLGDAAAALSAKGKKEFALPKHRVADNRLEIDAPWLAEVRRAIDDEFGYQFDVRLRGVKQGWSAVHPIPGSASGQHSLEVNYTSRRLTVGLTVWRGLTDEEKQRLADVLDDRKLGRFGFRMDPVEPSDYPHVSAVVEAKDDLAECLAVFVRIMGAAYFQGVDVELA